MSNSVLDYWNQRATLKDTAGSDDVIAKKIEINALSKHIRDGMLIAEFGCGNGSTAIELLKHYDIKLDCFDYSPAMIDSAKMLAKEYGLENKITFQVGDVREEKKLNKKYDLIYTERMIINLPDWKSQEKAICYLVSLLKFGGRYLMCENSKLGLDNLNTLRQAAGLEAIIPPWHNLYLEDHKVEEMISSVANLVGVESFSSTYYFLSRVVNAWLADKEGKKPTYDAAVNRLALELPAFGDCAQGKLWVIEKNITE